MKFLLLWIAGSVVSGVVLALLTTVLFASIFINAPINLSADLKPLLTLLLLGGLHGGAIGFAQCLLLYKKISRTGNALRVSFFGTSMGLVVFSTFFILAFFTLAVHIYFDSREAQLAAARGEVVVQPLTFFLALLLGAAIAGYVQGFIQWCIINDPRTRLLRWGFMSAVSGMIGLIVLLLSALNLNHPMSALIFR